LLSGAHSAQNQAEIAKTLIKLNYRALRRVGRCAASKLTPYSNVKHPKTVLTTREVGHALLLMRRSQTRACLHFERRNLFARASCAVACRALSSARQVAPQKR